MTTRQSLVAAAVSVAALTMSHSSAHAETSSFDFESYVAGSIDLQDGWTSSGDARSGCAAYDHQVVVNTGAPASFGRQSLRIPNSDRRGCFGARTFSKSLTDEAGEATATNGGMSGGSRQSTFEAQWDFASTLPGAEQPGLLVVASPDRGDGSPMSWIQMTDTPGGLAVTVNSYTDVAPFGDVGSASNGCGDGDNFNFTTVITGLDRSIPHTVKIAMDLIVGPRNDVVSVYVDGVLMHTDTSWEDYFRWCEASGVSRTVDSVLFRTGGTVRPLTVDNGFLIDNLTTTSGPIAIGARVAKQLVLAQLQAQPPVDHYTDKKIGEAIKHLQKSLDNAAWVDDNHLDGKRAEKVFDEERETVKKLGDIKNPSPSLAASIAGWIDSLVAADRILATTAISEGGSVADLAKANSELAEGDASEATGDFRKAIDHYKHAWRALDN